jgi:hypothetical protein
MAAAMVSWPDERKAFLRVCRRAFEAGLQVSTGGNLSLKLPGGLYLVKPSGIALYDLTRKTCSGRRYGKNRGGKRQAHQGNRDALSIYRRRRMSAALSTIIRRMRRLLRLRPNDSAFDGSRRTDSGKPSRHSARPRRKRNPGRQVEETFADPRIKPALLAGHGILAAGRDLTEAQNLAELVEETAKIAFLTDRLPSG